MKRAIAKVLRKLADRLDPRTIRASNITSGSISGHKIHNATVGKLRTIGENDDA